MDNKKLDWAVLLVIVVCVLLISYLGIKDNRSQSATTSEPKHDTTYIIKEYHSDTTVTIVRPRYFDTTIVNNITIIDSVYATKPFSLTDTVVTKKNDTMETIAKFPQMSITHLFRYSKDTVKTVTNTLYVDKFIEVPKPEAWYIKPAIGLGSVGVGYLFGRIK